MILITGASEGIGHACAQMVLSRTDHHVTITGRSAERLEAARANISAPLRHRLHLRVCDQSRRADVSALRAWIGESGTGLQGAVLNVGVNPAWIDGHCRVHKLAESCIEETISTNCTHTMLISASVLQGFTRSHGGVLIWIGSQAQRIGTPGAALYCATKSFLSGLARSAANEYGSRGVRTHLVNPGVVRTARTSAVADRFAARRGLRVHEPEEIAKYVVEILSASGCVPAEVNL